jgi:glycosyltransferase involved in cell wall biosynthesis
MKVQLHAADLGGCGHYRLIWPGSAAYYAGEDVDVVTPEDPRSVFDVEVDPFAPTPDGRPHMIAIKNPPEADVVVLQRPLTRELLEVLRLLQSSGYAVVVEVDDDFESIDPANVAYRTVHPTYSPNRNYRYLAQACREADLVTVTTPALAARYGRHGRVRIIPNMVPSSYLHVLPNTHEGIRVGWSGTIDTHPRDLQVTRGAVARALRRHGLTFHLIGSGRVRRPMPDGTEEEVTDVRILRNLNIGDGETFAHTGGWLPLEKYPMAMAELDVGLVPLELSAFNQAKSYLKGLEFAAVGRPFIASPTDPYLELAGLGAGLIARKPRDWELLLDRLIVDEDYRLELGAHGRRLVAAGHVIENNLDRWLDAWSASLELAARRR